MKTTALSREKTMLKGFHHAAIFCRDYDKTIDFYVNKLGLHLFRETYTAEQNKRKLELWLGGKYLLEIFVLPGIPEGNTEYRTGLVHLSFLAEDVPAAVSRLRELGVRTTEVMLDKGTGKRYAFFFDPDGQKLEIYEN